MSESPSLVVGMRCSEEKEEEEEEEEEEEGPQEMDPHGLPPMDLPLIERCARVDARAARRVTSDKAAGSGYRRPPTGCCKVKASQEMCPRLERFIVERLKRP